MTYRRPFEVSQSVENVCTDQLFVQDTDTEGRTDTFFSASSEDPPPFRVECSLKLCSKATILSCIAVMGWHSSTLAFLLPRLDLI